MTSPEMTGETVDGLVCGQDYTLRQGNSSAYSGTLGVKIDYLSEG